MDEELKIKFIERRYHLIQITNATLIREHHHMANYILGN